MDPVSTSDQPSSKPVFGPGIHALFFGLTIVVTQLALCLLVIGIAAAIAVVENGPSENYFRSFQDFAQEVFTEGMPRSLFAVLAYTIMLVPLSLYTGIVHSLIKLLSFGLGLSVLVFYASKTIVDKVYPSFFDAWQAEVVVFSASSISGLVGAWTLWRTMVWAKGRNKLREQSS